MRHYTSVWEKTRSAKGQQGFSRCSARRMFGVSPSRFCKKLRKTPPEPQRFAGQEPKRVYPAAMRKRFEVQLALGKTPIEKVVLPLKSRDELPPILAGLQWIF